MDAREPRGPQRGAGGWAEKPKAKSYDPAEWGSLPEERVSAVPAALPRGCESTRACARLGNMLASL